LTDRWQKGTFDHDGDGKPGGSISKAEAERRKRKEVTMTTKKTDKRVETDPAKLPEVESNHNTTEPAKPVQTAQVKSMPDYNPQRKPSSRANVQTDVTALDPNAVADAKGDRPTVAEADASNAWGENTVASEGPTDPEADKGAK
jgi:hypothetical protein